MRKPVRDDWPTEQEILAAAANTTTARELRRAMADFQEGAYGLQCHVNGLCPANAQQRGAAAERIFIEIFLAAAIAFTAYLKHTAELSKLVLQATAKPEGEA